MKLEIGKLIDDRYVIYLQYADVIAVGRHMSPTADNQYAVIGATDAEENDCVCVDAVFKNRVEAENYFRDVLWGDGK